MAWYSYILLILFIFTSLMCIFALIIGYVYAKMMPHFSPSFEEYWEKAEEEEWQWVKKIVNRHFRYVGFRIYTGWNVETEQWHRSIHFQVYKWLDKELFKWNIKDPDWWLYAKEN